MWKNLWGWLVGEPTKVKKEPDSLKLTAKEIATMAGEPYVAILNVEIDPNNINNGSFELDWNDKFVLNLIRAGYRINENDTDNMIVDRWFTQVCRNVVMEVYEQEMADPEKRMIEEIKNKDLRVISRKDLGDGRTEVS